MIYRGVWSPHEIVWVGRPTHLHPYNFLRGGSGFLSLRSPQRSCRFVSNAHTHSHTHTHTRKKSTTHFGQIIYTRAYAWRLFITFHFSLRPLCGMSEHASLYYIRKIKIARHIGIYCAKRSRNYRKTTVITIVRTHCALQVS